MIFGWQATGLAHGLTMVTANVREFACVPGLVVEVWGNLVERDEPR